MSAMAECTNFNRTISRELWRAMSDISLGNMAVCLFSVYYLLEVRGKTLNINVVSFSTTPPYCTATSFVSKL